MDLEKTQRGFAIGNFIDRSNTECSLQKSSLATEDAIWFGVSESKPQIMCSDAIKLGLRERTGTDADWGWCDFEIPKEVFISTRMHLTQDMVKEMLPILQKFAETGELT